jgi:hypothetical protein
MFCKPAGAEFETLQVFYTDLVNGSSVDRFRLVGDTGNDYFSCFWQRNMTGSNYYLFALGCRHAE